MVFQNDERNKALYLASVEQQIADKNVLRLVEEQKVNDDFRSPCASKYLHFMFSSLT